MARFTGANCPPSDKIRVLPISRGRNQPKPRVLLTFLSGLLAAVGGLLLSGRVSGAFLEMGTPFLLHRLALSSSEDHRSSAEWGRPSHLLGSIFLR